MAASSSKSGRCGPLTRGALHPVSVCWYIHFNWLSGCLLTYWEGARRGSGQQQPASSSSTTAASDHNGGTARSSSRVILSNHLPPQGFRTGSLVLPFSPSCPSIAMSLPSVHHHLLPLALLLALYNQTEWVENALFFQFLSIELREKAGQGGDGWKTSRTEGKEE